MLIHDITHALPQFRAQAEARMTARAIVRRPGGKTTDGSGFEVDGWTSIYPDLKCWVDRDGTGSRNVSIGTVEVQIATRLLKVPHDATNLRDNDVVQIVGGACDGRFFRVVEATFADQKKQQEIPVTETQEPEGWS